MQFWSNHLQLELITTSLFWFWIYSIFILEFQVKITTRNGADGDPQKGKAFIHYNQKLCRKEIERLFSHFNIEDPGEMSADISYGTNGHKSVCRYLLFSNLIVFCISFSGLNLSEIVQTCQKLFKYVMLKFSKTCSYDRFKFINTTSSCPASKHSHGLIVNIGCTDANAGNGKGGRNRK